MRRLVLAALVVSVSANVLFWTALSQARREASAAQSAAGNAVSSPGHTALSDAGAPAENGSDENERELARLRNENTLLRLQVNEATKATPPPRPFRRLPANAGLDEKFAAATNALASSEKWAHEEYDKRNSLIAELAGATPEQLANIKKRAESRQCIHNLKQIGLAARVYGNDNDEKLPADYWGMRNELGSPQILYCPSAPGGIQARDWQQFNPAAATYAWRGAGADLNNPNSVLTMCPYHGHIAVADGSVQSQPGHMPDL